MVDYFITWEYIVKQMEKKFGMTSTDKTPMAMAGIQKHIDDIWNDFFKERYIEELNE